MLDMNNDLQILQSVFDRIESRIKEEQKRKGIIASGRSAKSLKSTVSKSGSTIRGVLTGNESFEQQERGSTASENKKRPFAELLKDIREWTNYKKFSKSKPSHIKDIIAFQVTKHLRERGSLRGNYLRLSRIKHFRDHQRGNHQYEKQAIGKLCIKYSQPVNQGIEMKEVRNKYNPKALAQAGTLLPCFYDYNFLCYGIVRETGNGYTFLDEPTKELSVPKELGLAREALEGVLKDYFWSGNQIKAYFKSLGKEVKASYQNSAGKPVMMFASTEYLDKVVQHKELNG